MQKLKLFWYGAILFIFYINRMDASDIIRKTQSRAVFSGIKAVQQPLNQPPTSVLVV
jgi:hypothetical protein